MPLARFAQAIFGTSTWPENLIVPQAWIEFDVDDVEAATSELADRGYDLLVRARKEPWGQVVTRFLTPEGMVVGIVHDS